MLQADQQNAKLAHGLLRAINVLIDEAPDCEERARHIAALEAGVLPHVGLLLASKAYSQNYTKMIREIFDTGRLTLVKAVFHTYPEEAKHAAARLSDSIARRNISQAESDLLVYLAEEQEARPYGLGNLMAEAARRGDADLFERIAAAHHPLEPFWSSDEFQMMNAIDQCSPAMAPVLAHRLESAMQQRSPLLSSLSNGFFMAHDIKTISALLWAGCDLSGTGEYDSEPLCDELRALIAWSRSAHGRMKLRALEPSLTDILSRSPEGGVFFGLTYGNGKIAPAANTPEKETLSE
jgi:hypothetical protein